jgi:hypothetical protein
MSKVLKFQQHSQSIGIAEELIEMIFNPQMNESNDNVPSNRHINKILKTFQKDLSFNFGLVFNFGAGIRALYPTVENLIKNGNLKIEMDTESIVLLIFAALTVVYLEEKRNKAGDDRFACPDCKGTGKDIEECEDCEGKGCQYCGECPACHGRGYIKSVVTKDDARTILEELKLRGIGNGIVKKLVSALHAIKNLFKTIFKNTPYVISSFMEMFAYASILIPTMNAISAMVGKYHFTMENLASNFLSLGIGVTTFLARSGYNYLMTRLKNKLGIVDKGDISKPTATLPDIDNNPEDIEGVEQINEQ